MTRSPVKRWLGIEEKEETSEPECDHKVKKEERTKKTSLFNEVGMRIAYRFELSICKLCGNTVGYAYSTIQDFTRL